MQCKHKFAFFILFSFILANLSLGQDELKMVIDIFRHGARDPYFDNYNAQSYDEWGPFQAEVGELTATGMRQHYLLGKTLRDKYVTDMQFLSSYYNFTEIYVRSTDVNRTIQSAQSHMFGLFPDGTGQAMHANMSLTLAVPPWPEVDQFIPYSLGHTALPFQHQVLPIHMKSPDEDYLIVCPCNGLMPNISYQMGSVYYNEIVTAFEPLRVQLAEILNQPDLTFNDWLQIYDTFISNLFNGRPNPPAIKDAVLEEYAYFYAQYFFYVFYGQEFEVRMFTSNLYSYFVESFDTKLSGSNPIKLGVLSAHDSTIGALMVGLNITSYECIREMHDSGTTTAINCALTHPSYASSVILELYARNATYNFVKVLYNGEYVNLCNSLDHECDYAVFRQLLVSTTYPRDVFLAQCAGSSSKLKSTTEFLISNGGMSTGIEGKIQNYTANQFWLSFALWGVICLLLIIIAMMIITRKKSDIEANKSEVNLLQDKISINNAL